MQKLQEYDKQEQNTKKRSDDHRENGMKGSSTPKLELVRGFLTEPCGVVLNFVVFVLVFIDSELATCCVCVCVCICIYTCIHTLVYMLGF